MSRPRPTQSAQRKARDIAALAPVLFALLIMPPFVHLTGDAPPVAGIPAIVVYLFGIWIAAIALTAWNVRRLALARTMERGPDRSVGRGSGPSSDRLAPGGMPPGGIAPGEVSIQDGTAADGPSDRPG